MVSNEGNEKEKDLEFSFEDVINDVAQNDIETAKLESESSSSDDEEIHQTHSHSFTSLQWPQSYKYTLLLYYTYYYFFKSTAIISSFMPFFFSNWIKYVFILNFY